MRSMKAGSLDIVLAVNPERFEDDRRMRLCLTSLVRHLDPSGIGQLVVVVPDWVRKEELKVVTWTGESLPYPIRVLHDGEVVGRDRWVSSLGCWHLQQIIKISVADHILSDFYLTLDADVLLTKATRVNDLIIDGRAATTMHERSIHPGWWVGSAELLGTDPRLHADGMSVTPAILSRRIARDLMRHLEARVDGPWHRSVVEYLDELKRRHEWPSEPKPNHRTPTEYTLYYLFAEMRGLVSGYHTASRALWCRQQVFRPGDLEDLRARLRNARRDPGRFLVFQSTLGWAPERVWQAVHAPLGLKG